MTNPDPHRSAQLVSPQAYQVSFPFDITALGRTEQATYTEHVRQLIRQVLFTSPGERVNRPLFGCDLRRLVFDARRNEAALAVETMVQGSLQRWLGDIIHVQSLEIKLEDQTITADLHYVENLTQQTWFVRFLS
jgi:uncharacterized protein